MQMKHDTGFWQQTHSKKSQRKFYNKRADNITAIDIIQGGPKKPGPFFEVHNFFYIMT